MASEWRGWAGEKTWATLEGEFELTATADSLGHIRLGFFLRPADTGFNWELRGALELDAGQLEAIAHEIKAALGQDAL
jgi:primase-polymerase (primpol)-like protein